MYMMNRRIFFWDFGLSLTHIMNCIMYSFTYICEFLRYPK